MKMNAWLAGLAAVAWAGLAQAGSVGFETASTPVPGDKPLALTIWYPTDAPERTVPLALYTQSVAPGGAPAGRGHPLVVISHGTGGSNTDHYDTALALGGGLCRRCADPHRRHPRRPQPQHADHRASGGAVAGDRLHDPRLARP
jgi:predicted dienelactone hydrolase